MANPYTGEACLTLDGRTYTLKLTLGALAELESELAVGSLFELIERFEGQAFATSDLLALIVAGLRGGGWEGTQKDLLSMDIEGGAIEAARVAARLLALAFASPATQSAA